MAFNYRIYFTERSKNRIICWDPDTDDAQVVAGVSLDDDPSQRLNDPYGLAIDAEGNLLICDSNNDRICRLRNGTVEPLIFDSETETARRFSNPTGITIENDCIIAAFAVSDRIWKFSRSGEHQGVLGRASIPYEVVSLKEYIPPSEVAQHPLVSPTSLVSQLDGTLFFIEQRYGVLREYHPDTGLRCVFPVSRKPEYSPSPKRSAPKSRISDYHPPCPNGLALDSKQELYLADPVDGVVFHLDIQQNRMCRVIEPEPGYPPGRGPAALAFGRDGTAWVLNSATGSVDSYEPTANGPWRRGAKSLSNLNGIPLSLNPSEVGIVCS